MRPNRISILVLSLVCFTALTVTACHKRVTVAALPLDPSAPLPSALDLADRAFTAGNYDEAARAYENYLGGPASNTGRDHALFQLGLTYALRPVPATDWQRAASTFKQLISEFPDSTLKAPALLFLSLRNEIDQAATDTKNREQRLRQLTTELDRLKKIDADRRKKP